MTTGLTIREEGYEVGYEKGRKSKAGALFRILLQSRFDPLPCYDGWELTEEASLDQIHLWIDRTLTAKTRDELFDTTNS